MLLHKNINSTDGNEPDIEGRFTDLDGERYYRISGYDHMQPFFMQLVTSSNHWFFISSTGGLTVGRRSPDFALFPYLPVDKLHESIRHTGSKTLIRVRDSGGESLWEPFAGHSNEADRITRNIYKHVNGHKVCFEEVNHDLALSFRYSWTTSDEFGFVRSSQIDNLDDRSLDIDIVDGLQNLLPAGTPRFQQTNASNLVDAYKWNEVDAATTLALYTLYAGISDRAEPCESLRANRVFSLGIKPDNILITQGQYQRYLRDGTAHFVERSRGERGHYFITSRFKLRSAGDTRQWQIIADVDQSQSDIVRLSIALENPQALSKTIADSVERTDDRLQRLIANADGYQQTAEEHVSNHHYANTLFNLLRGGRFANNYEISTRDLNATIRHFNRDVLDRHEDWLTQLPSTLRVDELRERIESVDDPQLARLVHEYLPITFGRRHGDPSRPWNEFEVRLTDRSGRELLYYQGNWRDIFQNWEALLWSFPEFTENVIAKFVNASTVDGYNPYRITKDGIDWENEDPEDPWSYIGYWGDHQIIYLLKLLEFSVSANPSRLQQLLDQRIFSYANVPYRIKPFEQIVADAKNTIAFDSAQDAEIERLQQSLGADAKLKLDADGHVVLVNLFEKLLVPLLAKLSNLVADGGIWLNTQRPEWNDANNALVGNGVSVVTLCYLRRYLEFLTHLVPTGRRNFAVSAEVADWFSGTLHILTDNRELLQSSHSSDEQRWVLLEQLGRCASDYRTAAYRAESMQTRTDIATHQFHDFLKLALKYVDRSIANNRQASGLFETYNLLDLTNSGGSVALKRLYPMLEGQVAAISSGTLETPQVLEILKALYQSDIYRPDQDSFMLYPDRKLPGFLEKNVISAERVDAIPTLAQQVRQGETTLIEKDALGRLRFNANLINKEQLLGAISELTASGQLLDEGEQQAVIDLYEQVFDHASFTGRSGTMFGFEGLGCIYWHMVAKLLLSVQERYFNALDQNEAADDLRKLGQWYYRIRQGIGFNKSPAEYGAFPTDPYSHTPKHAGARQPGMTGQVKEEVLTRFGELGLRIQDGRVSIAPGLLRPQEFSDNPKPFRFLDIDGNWSSIELPPQSLAFTWCQVPFVYRLHNDLEGQIEILSDNGGNETIRGLTLSESDSQQLRQRNGAIRQVTVSIPTSQMAHWASE